MRIAIIPARGNSKRIPRKNIKLFCGKPMIYWSIKKAIDSKIFKKIIVSTDNSVIAKIANKYGAETPFIRPKYLSDDYTGTSDVVVHAIKYLRNIGYTLSEVCCVYATAAFLNNRDVKNALKILKTKKWKYVFSATSSGFPIFRTFKKDKTGKLKVLFPKQISYRSQDYPNVFTDAGQFYWAYSDTWIQKKVIFDKYSTFVTLPRWRVQDIDTLEDWKKAEKMSKFINLNQ